MRITSLNVLGVVVLLTGACDKRELSVAHVSAGAETFALTAEWPAFAQGPNAQIDILFMVDNSLSMKPLQDKLTAGFSAFMTTLETLPGGTPDLHIGVVSSDMGAGPNDAAAIPGCRLGGDAGWFQSMARGTTCGAGRLNAGQNFIIASNTPGTANFTGSIADAFSCIALLGDGGCGFEHQLSSVRHALDPALAPAGNVGFLRHDAMLAVILVTNEDDCSAPADATVFDPSSVYVSDPLGPLQSFRCNEFGHVCRVGDNFVHPPRDKEGELRECKSAEDGVLDKVSDFVAFLKNLKGDPARVFLAAVTGPATPYVVSLGPPANDDTQQWPMIDHSCVAADGTYADPAVRIAQAVSAFGGHGLLSNICGDTMGPILHEISSRFSRPLTPSCVPTPDPAGPGCTVVDRSVDDTGNKIAARLPSCTDAAGATPCWELLVDDATCGASARRLHVNRGSAAVPATLVTAIDCTAPHP
jgi:hypothetical protein